MLGKFTAHHKSNFMMHNSRMSVKGSTEFRPKRQCFSNALETAKGNQLKLAGDTVRAYTIK